MNLFRSNIALGSEGVFRTEEDVRGLIDIPVKIESFDHGVLWAERHLVFLTALIGHYRPFQILPQLLDEPEVCRNSRSRCVGIQEVAISQTFDPGPRCL